MVRDDHAQSGLDLDGASTGLGSQLHRNFLSNLAKTLIENLHLVFPEIAAVGSFGLLVLPSGNIAERPDKLHPKNGVSATLI
mmetsp:Transcript_48727/g.128764  ORF Transcript_48727/g.128764 Transcript_48727/m.128764 type:complete len:82 (-) Transcript_48727:104-349(-)